MLLRIEDHDRQRCRPEFETALLDDLDRLGIAPDEPATDDLRLGPSTYRQSDNGSVYAAAVDGLRAAGLAYACDCTRSTFAVWRSEHRGSWTGPGCPGGCRARDLPFEPAFGVRAALGDGRESWVDELRGPSSGAVAAAGDLLVRDRNGNWTYALCVVVDDLRHGVDLVVRGEDLSEATAPQIRLGRLLGRQAPPRFAHHPLVRRPDGSKLSKADGATGVGELLDAGRGVRHLLGEAAARVGLLERPRSITFAEALGLLT